MAFIPLVCRRKNQDGPRHHSYPWLMTSCRAIHVQSCFMAFTTARTEAPDSTAHLSPTRPIPSSPHPNQGRRRKNPADRFDHQVTQSHHRSGDAIRRFLVEKVLSFGNRIRVEDFLTLEQSCPGIGGIAVGKTQRGSQAQ